VLDYGTWMKGLQMTQSQPVRPRTERRTSESALGAARLSTIIASLPGISEQSLRATFKSLPSVQVVGTASGCLSALQLVRDRQADLVVLDANLPLEDVRELLRQLDREGLATRSLVLTATSGQVRHALAAGADAALRRDASIRQLSATVASFYLANPEDGPDRLDG
jgi:two-component system NarL family response regulator